MNTNVGCGYPNPDAGDLTGILRNRKGSPLFALVLGISNPGKPAQNAALRIGNRLVNDLTES